MYREIKCMFSMLSVECVSSSLHRSGIPERHLLKPHTNYASPSPSIQMSTGWHWEASGMHFDLGSRIAGLGYCKGLKMSGMCGFGY